MEILSGILDQSVFLVIEIFIIIFLIRSNSNYFIKNLLIISFTISILRLIIQVLAFQADIGIMLDIFYRNDGIANAALQSLSYISYFFLLLGISLSIRNKETRVANPQEVVTTGKKRIIGYTFLLFVVTFGLYFPFWLYGTVKDLRTDFKGEVPYTPGKAVGYLFIPVFNIFWFFYLVFTLPRIIFRIEGEYFNSNSELYLKPALISILMILLPIASNISSFIIDEFVFSTFLVSQVAFSISTISLYLVLQAKINEFYD